MFIDGRKIDDKTEIEADVCIVGAGAAGITIAREFIGTSFKVCLLESGGMEFDEATQSLYDGKNTGYPYYDLDILRLRYFGGTTNIWSGVSRPLDDIDFRVRSWVPYSGWPLELADLTQFYKRAHDICQLGPYSYSLGENRDSNAPGLPLKGNSILTTLYRENPVRFGQAYADEIKNADNIHAYLFSNALTFETDPDASTISRAEIGTLDGKRFRVNSRVYILATGGVENVRLLLNSDQTNSGGLGNSHDLVGRFFMEHLSITGAVYMPSQAQPMQLYLQGDATGRHGALIPSTEAQQNEEILNVYGALFPSSLRSGIKAVAPGLVSSIMALRSNMSVNDLAEHVRRISADLDDLALHTHRRVFRSGDVNREYYIVYQMEHAPDFDSRVTLDSERDRLGMRKVILNWRFGDLERKTLRRMNTMIAQAVGGAGIGRVREIPDDGENGWPPGVRGAWHQMGTTRMSQDPKHGVVNPNCRVHGINNLFVSGSSVFPTCGCSSPTLTIVALSIRLADHLKQVLRTG
jgi:choline dehydrogenase-like flavoprotein